ncbi:hypothetical protein HMPREF0576_0900 [Mobiluncus holmesii ATCC 35242]|uniref:DUF4870 domain-containing protein n=2 Tax=Mobiluncus holmesii TaxID=144178 RepID=E6M3R7_9ACTO|nr:hypothetical protein HMPREF0576_0900 [Mobiluncus holmesii ATCC 35242]STY88463.1 Uncharacterized protein conserved in bacteria [Mobiluncus holmesii]
MIPDQRIGFPVADNLSVMKNKYVKENERMWAMFAHLSVVIAMAVSAGWLSFLGPLIVWLVKKDSSPAVRVAAAGAFNFNVTMWLASIAGWIAFFTIILIPLSLILWLTVFVLTLWHSIRGAIAASNQQVYLYPWQLPILN